MGTTGNPGRRATVLGLAAAVVAAAAVFTPGAGVAGTSGVDRMLERLRDVTGAYHSPALAEAAGFEAEDVCVSSPDGGMGFHYPNPGRVQDDFVNRNKPEILLYAPARGNERALVGVEFWKVDADQDLATDDDRPSLFGRPFDGPMPGHVPGMPIHYDLHVWIWRSNPSGMFAPFNPRVECP